jgi:hypothetical protein
MLSMRLKRHFLELGTNFFLQWLPLGPIRMCLKGFYNFLIFRVFYKGFKKMAFLTACSAFLPHAEHALNNINRILTTYT